MSLFLLSKFTSNKLSFLSIGLLVLFLCIYQCIHVHVNIFKRTFFETFLPYFFHVILFLSCCVFHIPYYDFSFNRSLNEGWLLAPNQGSIGRKKS